jgi:PilZ domain-containing protein
MEMLSLLSPGQGLEVWWHGEQGDDAILGQIQSPGPGRLSAWLYGDALSGGQPAAGELVSLRAPTSRGLLIAAARVLDDDGDGLTRFEIVGAIKQLRRRQFQRVALDGDQAGAWLLDADGQVIELVEASLRNLSGGGIQFECLEVLPNHAQLRLELNLGEYGTVAVQAEVLERRPLETVWRPAGREGVYVRFLVRASFVALSDLDRQRIVRFVERRATQVAHLLGSRAS